jgi:hypothetical protein
MSTRRLPEDLARQVAVGSGTDPRTVQKVFRGEPVRGMAGRRAREALRAAGIKLAQDDAGEERES